MNNFIILGTARIGSNYLISILNQHPNIKTYDELFNLNSLSRDQLDETLKNPVKYLKRKMNAMFKRDIKAIGFKIFYCHAKKNNLIFKRSKLFEKSADSMKNKILSFHNYLKNNNIDLDHTGNKLEKVWEYLRDNKKISVIHLKRRNLLKTYLSMERAFITDKWTSGHGDKEKNEPIYFDYEDVIAFFNKTKKFEKEYDNFFKGHNKIDIYYEELIQDKEVTINKIFKFLSLPQILIRESNLKKQNKLSLSKSICNYFELKSKFKNTPWIQFFEE